MWEERSCRQTREWQHWGSGCYNYKCENGRLHILVLNYTFECFYKNQVLNINLLSDGWLHKGAIICPSCNEICGQEFKNRGETCKIQEEAPPPANHYHRDRLPCTGNNFHLNTVLLFSAILLNMVLR